ncbi:magnesium transporter MgtE N-terminal domain-containing protein [Terrisporobacter glycolicus]|uniref:magnesium transporter MgtE N-terminal domain-containing protein n=1 Tax=Terrisporobacter glycolicus TaxID=36841 RepID=UPI003464C56C
MVEVVSNLIKKRKILELSEYFADLNSVDIAKDMVNLKNEEIVLAFRILPKDIAVEVFSYLELDMQEYIIQSITDSELKDIVDKLFLDDTVDIIEELPSHMVKIVSLLGVVTFSP